MRDVEYESRGVPLGDYQLTRWDCRRQTELDRIDESADRRSKESLARVQADPEMAQRRRDALENAWKLMQSFKTPDHEIMRWRVRLYCGHITETRRHAEGATPTFYGSSSMRCPVCGKDPSAIVAFEPIGLVAEPPPPPPPEPSPPPRPRKPTRAELEHRVASLEAENARLRALKPSD